MTIEEKQHLDTLTKELNDLRKSFFAQARNLDRMKDSELSNTGHKTKDAAIAWTFRYFQKKIEKLNADFIKQFPDE